MFFKTIAGSVNKIPVRALTLHVGTTTHHIFNIESNSNWELRERARTHSRRISTVLGYSFRGEFSVPYNDLYQGDLLEALDKASNHNPAVEYDGYMKSAYDCVITLGNALPYGVSDSEEVPPISNSTDGYWIWLNHFALSYSVRTAELRQYLTINISAEMKKRSGGESPLIYKLPQKLFMKL